MTNTPKKPVTTRVVPLALQNISTFRVWICAVRKWDVKKNKWNKTPVDPRTMHLIDAFDPVNWLTGAQAEQFLASNPDLDLGLVMTGGLFLVDLDHQCINGQWTQLASDTYTTLQGAYFEVSCSQDGAHLIGMQQGLTWARKQRPEISVYLKDRWALITGNHATGDATLDCTAPLRGILERELPIERTDNGAVIEWTDSPVPEWPYKGSTDEEIIERICSHHESDSLIKGIRITGRQLWNRDPEVLNRYKDNESDMDLAFFDVVLPACGFNWDHAIELAKQSPYYAGKDDSHQKKWERRGYWRNTLGVAMGMLTYYRKRWAATHALPEPLPEDELPVHDGGSATSKCTDQANADRLVSRFGRQAMLVAKKFYNWVGTHWELDEEGVQRRAGHLSAIVRQEMADVAGQIGKLKPDQGDKANQYENLMKALDRWANKCEMASTQASALKLFSQRVTVRANLLDGDPWAFNCANGTVDLRTGELRPHNWRDRITKLSPVSYDPNAKCPRFERFLMEVFNSKAMVGFVQRWYGYCATGDISEQKMAIHYGNGSNGKSTLAVAIARVMGDYASSAPANFITGADKVHESHLASLQGRRLVSASESDDGARLREGTVKMLTGGDKIRGRYLYGEPFDFDPIHKMQLSTNYRPPIRGSDHGIWRRMLFIEYSQCFGTADEVARGVAQHLKDPNLEVTLAQEAPGILAWLVRGAMMWRRDGLNPPAEVTEATAEYREQQDTLGAFIRDTLELDPAARTPKAHVYNEYRAWCAASGIERHWTRLHLMQRLRERLAFEPASNGDIIGIRIKTCRA